MGPPADRGRQKRLRMTALSMPTADPRTPAPTRTASFASSSSPCTVPSSPLRSMEHRKHDVETDAGDRRGASRHQPPSSPNLARWQARCASPGCANEVGFASGADGTRAFEPRPALMTSGGGNRRRCFVSERPPAVLFNADGNGLAPAAVEMLDDRSRRGDRDLVLSRAAAVNHADT